MTGRKRESPKRNLESLTFALVPFITFLLHVFVILSTGGGVVSQHALQVVSQHALQVSRPTSRGEVEGSGQGGLQAHTGGGGSMPTPRGVCIPACTEADSPNSYYWNAFLCHINAERHVEIT